MLLPLSVFSNVRERNQYSAENMAISRLEQMVYGKWTGFEQQFLKKYSYAKSIAEFESQLSKTDGPVLFKNRASKSAGNRSIESGILNDGSLPLTEIWQYWSNPNWINSDKYSFKHDQTGNMTEVQYADWSAEKWNTRWIEIYSFTGENMVGELWQDWDPVNSVWINTDKWTNEFDAAGNITSMIYQYWENNAWQNYWYDMFKYDENGNEIEFISTQWNGSEWINSFRVTSVFDENGNLTERLGQQWDITNGWVINVFKTMISYDESGRMIEEQMQDYLNGNWVTTLRISHGYDENNNRIESLTQEFNGETLVDVFKESLLYNAQNKVIELFYLDWNVQSSIWQNNWRELMSYDAQGNQTEHISQEGNGDSWLNYAKDVLSFNEHNHLVTVTGYGWENGNWVTYWKGNFEYVAATGIIEEAVTLNQWRLEDNYPNPFNPSTTISYQLALDSQVDLSIYNLLGQRVSTLVSQKQPAGTYNVEWNASDLPSGVYFYQLQTGSGFVQSKKLVLLK